MAHSLLPNAQDERLGRRPLISQDRHAGSTPSDPCMKLVFSMLHARNFHVVPVSRFGKIELTTSAHVVRAQFYWVRLRSGRLAYDSDNRVRRQCSRRGYAKNGSLTTPVTLNITPASRVASIVYHYLQ